MKVFVIAAMHGDELFGLKIVGQMNSRGTNQVHARIGHPEAIAKHRRYIEEDLNRSFASKKDTREASMAQEIRQEVEGLGPDLVLDLHTARSNVGKVAIVAECNELTASVAQYLGMDTLVVMPKRLTDTSLIGVLPDRSISLEFGKFNRSDKLAAEIAQKIEALDISNLREAVTLPVFEVYDQIDKGFRQLSSIKNLVFNEELGGYPFLAGANTYESIGGFLAKRIR